jgi:hypothetical protein
MIPTDIAPEEVLARKLDGTGTLLFARDGEAHYYDAETRQVMPATDQFLDYVARDEHWAVNVDRMAEWRGRLAWG